MTKDRVDSFFYFILFILLTINFSIHFTGLTEVFFELNNFSAFTKIIQTNFLFTLFSLFLILSPFILIAILNNFNLFSRLKRMREVSFIGKVKSVTVKRKGLFNYYLIEYNSLYDNVHILKYRFFLIKRDLFKEGDYLFIDVNRQKIANQLFNKNNVLHIKNYFKAIPLVSTASIYQKKTKVFEGC